MNEDYEFDEEQLWGVVEETAKAYNPTELPQIVREFQKDAMKVSHYNEIPAAFGFFTILGNIVKEFVTIPRGRGREDTRIHFCWIQTSGTGKSTLWNFVGPVADKVFKKINEQEGDKRHPSYVSYSDNVERPSTFDIFGVTDYTDATLIGTLIEKIDDDGEIEYTPIRGLLEGSGLAHWDEFEYSGVFKQSQHKEQSIVYLNTLMNTLGGNSWEISKSLVSFGGEVLTCRSRKSVFATTYPPNNLNSVIAEKGVLQRMVMYVVNVPESVQHQMRLSQLNEIGTIDNATHPIDKYVDKIYEIYEAVRERYEDVGKDPLKTVRFTKDFNQTLILEYNIIRSSLSNTRKEVYELAGNFTNRMLINLAKLSVLVCISRSINIKNKDDRFLVTPSHVQEASILMTKCFNSLVSWLEQSLKTKKASITGGTLEPKLLHIYSTMEKDEDGFVHKTKYMTEACEKLNKSMAQIYRHFKEIEHKFEVKKQGKYAYISLIKKESIGEGEQR